jgi:hypothetical protein
MKDYIPELSELRMVNRAPDGPLPFSAGDRAYILACFDDVETSFGARAFPETATADLTAKALIHQLILYWRTLEPETEAQKDAYGRMPGAIRLIDTVATFLEEQEAGRRDRTAPARG